MGSLLNGRHSAGTKRQEISKAPEGKQTTGVPSHSLRSSDYSPVTAAAPPLPPLPHPPHARGFPTPSTDSQPHLLPAPAQSAEQLYLWSCALVGGASAQAGSHSSCVESGWELGGSRRGRRLRAVLGGGEPGNPSRGVGGGREWPANQADGATSGNDA
uniref:Uncharacterized protein n=1 Tax=Molossus molossus TaxID=27622 RepID=A0A7J8F918_MOLMO|nr:hypothetical protein HJG59_008503 [Molossus molossus]